MDDQSLVTNWRNFAPFLHQSVTFSGFHCFHFLCVLFLVIYFQPPPSKIRDSGLWGEEPTALMTHHRPTFNVHTIGCPHPHVFRIHKLILYYIIKRFARSLNFQANCFLIVYEYLNSWDLEDNSTIWQPIKFMHMSAEPK